MYTLSAVVPAIFGLLILHSVCCMKVDAEFEERWNAGTVQGWEDKGLGTEQTSSRVQPLIDVEDYDNVEELMELGPDRLKEVHFLASDSLFSVIVGQLYCVSLGIW